MGYCRCEARTIASGSPRSIPITTFGSVYEFMPDARLSVANSWMGPEQLEGHADPRTDLYVAEPDARNGETPR